MRRDGEIAVGSTVPSSADQQRDADADDGYDRHRRILERMQEEHVLLRHALGQGGADIVLLQHFEHGGPRNAGDQRDIDQAQRDRGQDEVPQPGPEAFGDRRVALHRQPVELQREDPRKQVADDEDRHGEAQHRETHRRLVDPASGLPGRDDAHRHGDYHREDQRQHHQRDGGLDGWEMSCVTGREVKIEVPRSPCSTRHDHSPKRMR